MNKQSAVNQCPNCQSPSLMRVKRTRMDKLHRVQAKYRCQNCRENFETRKPKVSIFDRLRLRIQKSS